MGNVWEWCQDLYGEYSSNVIIDPTGSETGKARLIKGGCWIVEAKYCRPARRSRINPNHKSNTVGFRLAKEYHKMDEEKWEPEDIETKKYILNKVLGLGSIEEVKKFYSHNSRVCEYAKRIALENLESSKEVTDEIEISDWPLKKTNDNISDSRLLEIRKKYRRAYEPWSAKEDDLLRQHFKENKDTKSLAKLFQRNPGAIRSRLRKIGLIM